MCPKWWPLFLLFCSGFLVCPHHLIAFTNCQIVDFPSPDTDLGFTVDPPENMTTSTVNWTSSTAGDGTTAPPTAENTTQKVVVEPVHCTSDKDCEIEFGDPKVVFICNPSVGMCVVGKPVEPPNNGETIPPTTQRPKRTTPGPNVQPPAKPSSTAAPPNPGENKQTDFSNVPYVVWILMVIPFVSIIVLGVLCGRRLKAQSLNIQENLMRTTINGVHVDQLLSQRELLNSLAFSRPPPTYEKATGEIPPSYETFLQALQEKRQSIFNCDSLMNEPDKLERGSLSAESFSSGSGSLRSLPINNHHHHHRTGRGSPLIFAISHTNVP